MTNHDADDAPAPVLTLADVTSSPIAELRWGDHWIQVDTRNMDSRWWRDARPAGPGEYALARTEGWGEWDHEDLYDIMNDPCRMIGLVEADRPPSSRGPIAGEA